MPPVLNVTSRLDPDQVAAVESLLTAAEQTDKTPPVNEAGRLLLHHPRPGSRHLLAYDEDALVGYAQLEDDVQQTTAQLVVAPSARRRGIGRALLDRTVGEAAGPLRIWAMGDSAGARSLAAYADLRRLRELLIMTRPLDETLPAAAAAPVPAGVRVRTFRPGEDEPGWLAVNAAAFASHPEQGRLTRGDLDERLAERWFDPEGFFLAVTDDAVGAESMVGFHWTKQHPGELGEVYVLGVAPTTSGRGLGKALLGIGLRHLRDRGNTTVELYVEADHQGAVGLYRGSGFTVAGRDVMYGQG